MFNSDIPTKAELPGTARLISSTLLALVGAGVLLVTVVLPAEYGIDPTGIGEKLGLNDIHQASSKQASMVINAANTDEWRDDVSVTIPGYGEVELKLTMNKGDVANYEWHTDGGELYCDLHGDGADETFISYRIGEEESKDSGTLTAEFNGTHGWYWVNKERKDVTVTLRTNGVYDELKQVK